MILYYPELLRCYGECMRKSWGVETSRLGKIVKPSLVWGTYKEGKMVTAGD